MQGFDALNPPFDRLTNQEIQELKASLDIGYFRRGEAIVQQGRPSEFLFVIIKGAVEDRAGDTLQAVLGPKDTFDARALCVNLCRRQHALRGIAQLCGVADPECHDARLGLVCNVAR